MLAVGLLASTHAFAQGGGASTTGSINGKVADSSGGVLPGVTVNATRIPSGETWGSDPIRRARKSSTVRGRLDSASAGSAQAAWRPIARRIVRRSCFKGCLVGFMVFEL